jgi:hypothetical protein
LEKILSREIRQDEFNLWIDVYKVGEGLFVTLFNENEHLGGIGMGMFHEGEKRAYSSAFSYPGHRDDEVAKYAAHQVAKATKRNTCALAGIHLDRISGSVIDKIMACVKNEVDWISRNMTIR